MESEIELWKTKRLLKSLKDASGNGTSMISIILKPGESISKMNQKLTEEYGTAGNIKKRVTRQSVESAIVSAQQKLKLYNKCPKNGLCIFSGEVNGEDNKEKKITIDFEPFKPINTTMYMCDDHFHVEPLEELLLDNKTFAFIIVDGNEYMLATITGNTKQVLDTDDVNLPSKTRRGGQSSNRFARIRDEARAQWVKDVCESLHKSLVANNYIDKIQGVIIAGNADIKSKMFESAHFEPRIKKKVITPLLDVAYGGNNGLKDAVALSRDVLGNVKFVEERVVLEKYFMAIAKEENVAYGEKDVMFALLGGAVEKLLLWENLPLERRSLKKGDTEEESVYIKICKPDEKLAKGEILVEKVTLLDWLIENRKDFGADISIVSDNTPEGIQFAKGFGGIGAFLRYKMDFETYEDVDEDDFISDDDI